MWVETLPDDAYLSPRGRVVEVLSEHLCQGWLEGYLLTGRYGLFNCYEAFVHIVDSMFNQYSKWLSTSRDYINVIVAGKQPEPTYLDMDEAIAHCTRGLGIWPWASNLADEPDVVLACAGDVPALETMAAADILLRELPGLAVRVVNVVDLMCLQPESEHPHGGAGQGVRRPVHPRQARHLRLPRLPVADPPAHLSAPRAPAPACARLQEARHHDDAVRHGDAKRPGPLPSGHGRDRPGGRAGQPRRGAPSADGRRASRGATRARTTPRSPADLGVERAERT